jgi:hypothetical protein
LRLFRTKLRLELVELIEEGHVGECETYARRMNFAPIQPASTRPDSMSQL